MITINDKGRLAFKMSHLQAPAIEKFEGILNRLDGMEMRLFYHIVSSPTSRYERGYGAGRISQEITAMSPKQRFMNILKTQNIIGNPKSFFVNKQDPSITPIQFDSIKSVSFTFASIEELSVQFDARGSEYGICFYHDFLQDNGINPVVYLNEESETEIENILFNSPYLIETYSNRYDMRWEKEWRIKGRLSFGYDDIAFLIVPDNAYKEILDWLYSDKELSGYFFKIILSSTYTSYVDHLKSLPFMDDSSWHQIELFGGLLLDFEMFPQVLPDEYESMKAAAGRHLQALAKSTIQEAYEHRYIDRFINFINKLNNETKESRLFSNFQNIKKNAGEAWQSNRELVIHCYEELYKIQQKRINL